MQAFMLRLDEALRRHRRVVLVGWIVVLVAAIPFALRQSDHLTGGGFGVPGSQSDTVDRSLAAQFDGAQRARLAGIFVPERGTSAGDMRAALAKVADATASVAQVSLPRTARTAAAE